MALWNDLLQGAVFFWDGSDAGTLVNLSRWIVIGLAALLGVLPGYSMAAQTPSGPLIFAGSGSNVPITRLLAEAFRLVHPEITIEIPASLGSGGGIRAAADGAIAVGLISRPLKDAEQGWGLTVLPYAKTAVIVGVHPSVAEDGITYEELVLIFRGIKTRWQDGHPIVVLTREPGDSSLEVLERDIPGFLAASAESYRTRRWKTLYTDQEMTATLARTPYALGIADLGTVAAERLPIRALKLNGHVASPEHVRSGSYPLVKTLAFVFRRDRLPAGARAFLDFVRGPAGAKILQANGYVLEE
ncbi:MAG TPA: substrate-binding domain-containing protein [Candidatus Methylomirabilis sp.]|nr:substrate-binding domain-containing protein [Candidatus Methylomirabilis sp.]